MYWVLQNNLFQEEGHTQLEDALKHQGIPYSIHKIVPFTTELSPTVSVENQDVICFGSYSMLRIAKANEWTPGVFALNNFTHQQLQEKWKGNMLNIGKQTIFEAIPHTKEFALTEFFIRPATDEKFFVGRVYNRSEFLAWWENIVINRHDYGNGLTAETPVLISEVQEIYSEYRTWIINGKVVTSSSYRLQNKSITDAPVEEDIINYANNCAQIWSPEIAYCLDICRTANGLKIVEPNTINFSGFYNGDIAKIVKELENISVPK